MWANNTSRQTRESSGELFFSLSELQKLVEQENACVSVVTTKRSISLMPMHLKDLKASIKELLKAKVNRYDVQLEGVILAHKNVKLMVNSTLLSDSRFFHVEYLADIYVFKPKVGNRLTGIVNKVTEEYINILVHGIFNVTVYSSGSQQVGNLKIGCQVVVKVTALDYTGRLPFIKASIISSGHGGEAQGDAANLKKRKKKSRRHEEEENSLIGVSQREESSSLIGISQRKGIVSILKNSPLRIAQQSSAELESQDAESSSTESSKARTRGDTPPAREEVMEAPKKKKKKKSKSDEVILGENLSKKRKREEEDGNDAISPKKKKKKEKQKDKEIEGNEITMKPSLDNTAQIQADESIFKAASSTPILGPPPSLKKKKRKHSDKAESALTKSLLQMKMEEMATHGIEPIDTAVNSSGTKEKSKLKKIKIKQETVESHGSRDNSSSIDADSQASGGKKKKKKKKIKTEPLLTWPNQCCPKH